VTQRRRPGQLREELLVTARESFRTSGYAGSSLRQIAAQAGTKQAMIYRYFDSKADLFEAAVLEPFANFLDELNEQWRDTDATKLSNDDLITGLTSQIYQFALTHRADLFTLLVASVFDDGAPSILPRFAELLRAMTNEGLAQRKGRDWGPMDVETAIPIALTMMFSAAMLEDWFFPSGDARPSRDRILAELTAFGQARSRAASDASQTRR
jgi:AcrR family transcriptional regulator